VDANYSTPLSRLSEPPMAARLTPPATPLLVGERHLPDDVLQRVLVGLPLEDHRAAASVCTSFRDVITGPRFLALRKRYGFAEHSIVIVASVEIDGQANDISRIRVSHKTGGTASILDRRVISSKSTTDRGSRLFVSTEQPGATPSQILAVDVSSRRWRPFATPPRNQRYHCMEWHGGLLYVAGGHTRGVGGSHYLDSLHAFNEATGLWEDLPSMPRVCCYGASGVIGNELFIAGGFNFSRGDLATLQIYDIAARTWRLGSPLPDELTRSGTSQLHGVVLDGKLFVVPSRGESILVYEPESNSWAEEPGFPGYPEMGRTVRAFAHGGRLVVFQRNGAAFWRTSDGVTWLRHVPADPLPEELGQSHSYLAAGSLLLG